MSSKDYVGASCLSSINHKTRDKGTTHPHSSHPNPTNKEEALLLVVTLASLHPQGRVVITLLPKDTQAIHKATHHHKVTTSNSQCMYSSRDPIIREVVPLLLGLRVV